MPQDRNMQKEYINQQPSGQASSQLGSSSAGTVRVKKERVKSEIISISTKRLVAKAGNYVVFLTKNRNTVHMSLWLHENGKIYSVVRVDVEGSADIISYVKDEKLGRWIWSLITNWTIYYEKEIVEAIFRGVKSAPTTVKEDESLATALADLVLRSNTIKTFITETASRKFDIIGVYCFNKETGVYEECEARLQSEVEKALEESPLMGSKITSKIVTEVIEKVKRKTMQQYTPLERSLSFKGKIFSWDRFIATGDLESSLYDPDPNMIVEHYIPWKINLELWRDKRKGLERYIPPQSAGDIAEIFKALAPKIYDAFLSWVRYPGEAEENAKPRAVLLVEGVGYTLYPHAYPFQKAFLIIGSGSNGKTTYLNLLEKVVGAWNAASVNLQHLDPRVNRFATAQLYKKLLNRSAEPIRVLTFDPTLFKQLTGEDTIMCEEKFEKPFPCRLYAKLFFAANELPNVAEDTYAFWRRWVVIEFPNRFKQDPFFEKRVFTEQEIEGLIIAALHAFRLAMLRGGFTEEGAKDVREEWLSRSSPIYRVIRFLEGEGVIELDPQGWVLVEDLYELYREGCEKMARETGDRCKPADQGVFTRAVKKLFGIRKTQKLVAGKKPYAYEGVKIKDWDKAKALVNRDLKTPGRG